MKITYDKEVDALYIYFKKGKINKTMEIGDYFFADLDKSGNILGMEVLNASKKTGGDRKSPSVILGKRSLRIPALTF